MMLVLAIMALTSLVTVMTLSDSAQDKAEWQARQFYHRVQLLQDEALLSGQEFGVHINTQTNTLTLLGLASQGWAPLNWSKMKSKIVVDQNLELDFNLSSDIWSDDERLFLTQALESEAVLDDANTQASPQILIMSHGGVTAFTLRFTVKARQHIGWVVQGSDSGELQLKALAVTENE
jgi:general secretion pathway protein H